MKKLPLNKRNFKGQYALVDDSDFEWLSRWNWTLVGSGYPFRKGRKCEGYFYRKTIYLHRQVLNIRESSLVCDHINHDKLDSRRSNLRICTHTQNQYNRNLNRSSLSGYKGVSWKKEIRRWRAVISVNNKSIHIGYFKTKEHAALAYNDAAKKYGGEFVLLNEVKL